MASGKKKISQSELRRLMSQHKNKQPKKIVSAVAKYTDSGQLTCTVCNTTLVSDRVWESHKNSKQHLDNINRLKRELEPPPDTHVWKRPLKLDVTLPPPSKKLKGILKNATSKSEEVDTPSNKLSSAIYEMCPVCNIQVVPSLWAAHLTSSVHLANSNLHSVPSSALDQSSSTLLGAGVETKRLSVKLRELQTDPNHPEREKSDQVNAVNTGNVDSGGSGDDEDGTDKKGGKPDEVLPEGFFDDPMLDAKARNIEYKDPVEEEWEKFQKVMKEESSVSAQIIAEDQDEATVERQIDEIDEQMRNWSRVLDLERRKEVLEQENAGKEHRDEDGSSSTEETDFEEFLDWRVKKAFK